MEAAAADSLPAGPERLCRRIALFSCIVQGVCLMAFRPIAEAQDVPIPFEFVIGLALLLPACGLPCLCIGLMSLRRPTADRQGAAWTAILGAAAVSGSWFLMIVWHLAILSGWD